MEDSNYDIQIESETKSGKISGKSRRLRNLPQYRDLSNEDFEKLMQEREGSINVSSEFEKIIESKLKEYSEDYDLSDLKINDRDTLRALIQAHLSLEHYEQELFKLRKQGLGGNTMMLVEKFQKAMSDLRTDIAKLQTELSISRKSRKSDKDASVLAYIQDLQQKAKTFYESKMGYIFCPKCNMLLATIWTQFPDNERNKIALICGRTMPDGSKCDEKVIVSTKELLRGRGTNKPEITPESML